MPGRTPLVRTLAALLFAALIAPQLVGCRSTRTNTPVAIEAGGYERAFDTVRDVLTDARFQLERVDARAGVISTQPKPTVGLFTPWDAEQSTLGQEWEDATNQQERVVRVVFEPATGPTPAPGPETPLPDLRDTAQPLVARVEVVVYRVRWPGWRPETESIRRSTRAEDPLQRARGVYPGQRTELSTDPALAARVAERIRNRLRAGSAQTTGEPQG